MKALVILVIGLLAFETMDFAVASAQPSELPSNMPSDKTSEQPLESPIVPVINHARLLVIDKRTARKQEYTLQEGRSFMHESLQVVVKRCWNEPIPAKGTLLNLEQAALVDITETGSDSASHLIFSGWMFVHKSELSNLQHQAYDVTLLSCGTLAPEAKHEPDAQKKTLELPEDDSPPSD